MTKPSPESQLIFPLDELIEIISDNNIKKSDADKIIMDSRKHWFKDEKKDKNTVLKK